MAPSARQLIDVHSHFVPDRYRREAIAAGHEQPDGMPGLPAWDEAAMLATMGRLGIGRSILSISSPGVHFGDDTAARTLARAVNEEGARLKAAHPEKFGFFASLPAPDADGALREIEHAFDTLAADGVVLLSNSRGVYPGEAAMAPIFAELDRRSAVLFLHPTSPYCPACMPRENAIPRPVLEFMFETTRAVTDLILSGTLERHPNIRLIVPHAGATLPVLADRILMTASALPNMGATTPGAILKSLGKLYYDMAGAPVPRLLPALRTLADPSRLLYGSDWPFTPEPRVSRLLGDLQNFLSAEPTLLEGILRNNASALLPGSGRSVS